MTASKSSKSPDPLMKATLVSEISDIMFRNSGAGDPTVEYRICNIVNCVFLNIYTILIFDIELVQGWTRK